MLRFFVGASLLAKNSQAPRSIRKHALSLRFFASKLAPTEGDIRLSEQHYANPAKPGHYLRLQEKHRYETGVPSPNARPHLRMTRFTADTNEAMNSGLWTILSWVVSITTEASTPWPMPASSAVPIMWRSTSDLL